MGMAAEALLLGFGVARLPGPRVRRRAPAFEPAAAALAITPRPGRTRLFRRDPRSEESRKLDGLSKALRRVARRRRRWCRPSPPDTTSTLTVGS